MQRSSVPGVKVLHNEFVDNFIVDNICVPLAPVFKRTHHSANMISVYGLCFTLSSLYYMVKDDMLRFTIYFWLAYVLDCMDGYYARRYDMVTNLGDYFEHARDVLSVGAMLLITIWKHYSDLSYFTTFIIVGSSLLTGMHVGCVQKLYNGPGEETLDGLKILCFDDSVMQLTSYFGTGVYMLVINTLILYLSRGIFYFVKIIISILAPLYFLGLVQVGAREPTLDEDDLLAYHQDEVITVPVVQFIDSFTSQEQFAIDEKETIKEDKNKDTITVGETK
jgi:phosphatidylglycerophosphate synthase